jgi:hypothetical protein
MSSHPALADELHCARLRSFLARLFMERHSRADFELCESSAENTVPAEIDVSPIGGLKETKPLDRIDPGDGIGWHIAAGLDLPLRPPNMILGAPAGSLEGVVDRKRRIGQSFVGRATDVDLAAIWKSQSNVHFVGPAGLMVPAWPFDVMRPNRCSRSAMRVEIAALMRSLALIALRRAGRSRSPSYKSVQEQPNCESPSSR